MKSVDDENILAKKLQVTLSGNKWWFSHEGSNRVQGPSIIYGNGAAPVWYISPEISSKPTGEQAVKLYVHKYGSKVWRGRMNELARLEGPCKL